MANSASASTRLLSLSPDSSHLSCVHSHPKFSDKPMRQNQPANESVGLHLSSLRQWCAVWLLHNACIQSSILDKMILAGNPVIISGERSFSRIAIGTAGDCEGHIRGGSRRQALQIDPQRSELYSTVHYAAAGATKPRERCR